MGIHARNTPLRRRKPDDARINDQDHELSYWSEKPAFRAMSYARQSKTPVTMVKDVQRHTQADQLTDSARKNRRC
jgi:hypothetical protein